MQGNKAISSLARLGRRLKGANLPIVLMFHRIGTPAVDPWELSVSPENFGRQVAALKAERDIVPLHWLAQKLYEGRLPKNVAAITFDDGYADVLQNGLPILQHSGAPATMFVTTKVIGDPSVFWWDVLTRIILDTKPLPEYLNLEIQGVSFQRRLKDTHQDGTGTALKLHFELHALLKSLALSHRLAALERIAEWAGTDATPRECDRVMTEAELVPFSAVDGISIGAHTVTHPSLPALDEDDLHREVVHSRRQCEDIIGRPVRGFAYPFGDHNDAVVSAVRASGMDHAVTVEPHAVEAKTDLLRIPRIMVADWNEADFRRKVLCHG